VDGRRLCERQPRKADGPASGKADGRGAGPGGGGGEREDRGGRPHRGARDGAGRGRGALGRRHLRPLPPAGLHHPAQDRAHTRLERQRLQGGAHRDDRRDRRPEDHQDEVPAIQADPGDLLRHPDMIAHADSKRRFGPCFAL